MYMPIVKRTYKSELKKNAKDALKKIHRETELLIQKLKKTNKRNPDYPKCEQFCKNDYLVETNKIFKQSAKKYKIPYTPSKQEDHFLNNVCKKTFCNTKCDGYDFMVKSRKSNFIKGKTKNGFNKTYKKNTIDG